MCDFYGVEVSPDLAVVVIVMASNCRQYVALSGARQFLLGSSEFSNLRKYPYKYYYFSRRPVSYKRGLTARRLNKQYSPYSYCLLCWLGENGLCGKCNGGPHGTAVLNHFRQERKGTSLLSLLVPEITQRTYRTN